VIGAVGYMQRKLWGKGGGLLMGLCRPSLAHQETHSLEIRAGVWRALER
jgi:hypothetical protein